MVATAPISLATQRLCAIVCGLAGLTPLLWYHSQFAGLFWFADDVGLLAEFDHYGFRFLGRLFAENFIPLYKLCWFIVFKFTHGGYFGLIVVEWLTHACVLGLFARWLLRMEFGMYATVFCVLVFGLSISHVETLGWVTQWSSVLSTVFFLLACNLIVSTEDSGGHFSPTRALLIGLLGGASAMSFSRGILTGVCSAALYLSGPSSTAQPFRARALRTALMILPGCVVVLLIFWLPNPNSIFLVAHPQRWWRGVVFASWYLAGSPVLPVLSSSLLSHTQAQVWLCGVTKVVIVVAAFSFARGRKRQVLIALLLFELGFAAQLGLGRSEGEPYLALSSRYQYASFFVFMPFLAVVIEAIVDRLFPARQTSRVVWALTFSLALGCVTRHWAADLSGWVDWRGLQTRRVIFDPPPPGETAPSTIAGVSTDQLKALTAKYGLH